MKGSLGALFDRWRSVGPRARLASAYLKAALAVLVAISFVLLMQPIMVVPNSGIIFLLVLLAVGFWLGTGPSSFVLLLSLLAVTYLYAPSEHPSVLLVRLAIMALALLVGVYLARLARRTAGLAAKLADANALLNDKSIALAAAAQKHLSELNALLDSLVEGVTLVDGSGRVVFVNEAGRHIWRSSGPLSTWIAPRYASLDIRYPDGQPMPFECWPINRALRGERFAGCEVLYLRPDGRRYYLNFSGSAVRDEHGAVVTAINVYRDVTELRELQLLKDEFLEVAAHELKTPVAVLKGYSQMLVRLPEIITPSYQRVLGSIERQTTRIDALVRDLLDVSRLRGGSLILHCETVALSELVEAAANHAALRTLCHQIHVCVPEPVMVCGDRERLEQVLWRLIDNAIRYSPAGGDVDVTLSIADGLARCTVGDRGVGIPLERQSRIFERFYRAHSGTAYDFGGMGVGLYIAREVVHGLGGRIGFESVEGEGSTFYFTVPLAQQRHNGTH